MAKKKLGELLIEHGIIDEDQLNAALAYQRQWGHRLGVALVAKGILTEGQLVRILSKVLGIPMVDLSTVVFDSQALKLLAVKTCETNDMIPFTLEEKRPGSKLLHVAMADPGNMTIVEEIEFTTGFKTQPHLATNSAISAAISKYYRGSKIDIPALRMFPGGNISDSGVMELVRPGGLVEKIDTAVGDNPLQARPIHVTDDEIEALPSPEGRPPVTLQDIEAVQKLEKYFWAMMRVLARKGFVTKDEFLSELKK